MTKTWLWLLILALSLASFFLRGSFLLSERLSLPKSFDKFLRFVPPAVLAALIAPTLMPKPEQQGAELVQAQPIALAIAFIIAFRSKNILLTLFGGMLSLWLSRWLLNH